MADEEDQTEENEATEGEEGEEGKKGGKKKLLIILLAVLLLLGGGGGAAYYLGYLDSLLGVKKECPEPELDKDGKPIPKLDENGDPIECEMEEKEGEDKDKSGDKEKDKKKAKKKDGKDKGKGGDDESQFVAVTPITVNLTSEDDTPRVLRLKVQLQLADPADSADVKASMAVLEDSFLLYLRGLRVRDLRGSAGAYRLQIELFNRAKKALDPIEIEDVLFQEILIQ